MQIITKINITTRKTNIWDRVEKKKQVLLCDNGGKEERKTNSNIYTLSVPNGMSTFQNGTKL